MNMYYLFHTRKKLTCIHVLNAMLMAVQTSGTNSDIICLEILKVYMRLVNESPLGEETESDCEPVGSRNCYPKLRLLFHNTWSDHFQKTFKINWTHTNKISKPHFILQSKCVKKIVSMLIPILE